MRCRDFGPVFAEAKYGPAKLAVFDDQIEFSPWAQGMMNKSSIRMRNRLRAHVCITTATRAGKSLLVIAACERDKAHMTYLKPVMGRIKASSTNFDFPPSFRPVRAFHLKPMLFSSHISVASVTAAGPVRVRGSTLLESYEVASFSRRTSSRRFSMNCFRAGWSGADASAHWVSWMG